MRINALGNDLLLWDGCFINSALDKTCFSQLVLITMYELLSVKNLLQEPGSDGTHL